MPLMIMVLVSSLAVFQMFFRYEHWNSEKYDGIVYERDGLTGEIHVLQPGQHVDLISRVFGRQVILPQNLDDVMADEINTSPNTDLSNAILIEPMVMAEVEEQTQAATTNTVTSQPVAAVKTTATTQKAEEPKKAEAVQMAMISDSKTLKKKTTTVADRIHPESSPKGKPTLQDRFMSRQIDLNLDGDSEEIVQSVSLDDGLIDISVVRHNKEIFYGRGKYLHILSSRRYGWSDIALNINDSEVKYFQYNPKEDGYNLISSRPK